MDIAGNLLRNAVLVQPFYLHVVSCAAEFVFKHQSDKKGSGVLFCLVRAVPALNSCAECFSTSQGTWEGIFCEQTTNDTRITTCEAHLVLTDCPVYNCNLQWLRSDRIMLTSDQGCRPSEYRADSR